MSDKKRLPRVNTPELAGTRFPGPFTGNSAQRTIWYSARPRGLISPLSDLLVLSEKSELDVQPKYVCMPVPRLVDGCNG